MKNKHKLEHKLREWDSSNYS